MKEGLEVQDCIEKREVSDLIKNPVSYNAQKNCKKLENFFGEVKEEEPAE
jgi:hypothetical protein